MSLSYLHEFQTRALPIIAHVSHISGTSPLHEDRWPSGGGVERWRVVEEWLRLLAEEREEYGDGSEYEEDGVDKSGF